MNELFSVINYLFLIIINKIDIDTFKNTLINILCNYNNSQVSPGGLC